MRAAAYADVPTDNPVHFHCFERLEWSHDPKNWDDVAALSADHTAWEPTEASDWTRSRLSGYTSEAETAHGRRDWAEHALKDDDLWERQAASLARGRWKLLMFYLRPRHILVFTTLVVADTKCQHSRAA